MFSYGITTWKLGPSIALMGLAFVALPNARGLADECPSFDPECVSKSSGPAPCHPGGDDILVGGEADCHPEDIEDTCWINVAEMGIAVNPRDPNNLVVAIVGPTKNWGPHDPLWVHAFQSTNGGATWSLTAFQEPPETTGGMVVWKRADPSVAFDANGNVFVAYLAADYDTSDQRVIVAKSSNGGVSYTQFVQVSDVTADMFVDKALDTQDIPCFIAMLLGDLGCVTCPGAQQRTGLDDCNGNGIHDEVDIFEGTSQDCNANYTPDECDVDPADPDGNGLVSNDLNTNGIPDECEPDCNTNGVPDDKDIADQTSSDVNGNSIPDECELDCNGNGIPDDWDLSQGTSADCNNNAWPDECDEDCNGNGVPDDCEVDPTDPDGDGQVSPDCNGNGWPDACDLTLGPPLGSLDCNNNGIPDECDLANCQGDPACDDCNSNGIPDGCDIASGISADLDQNGIPDECETGWGEGDGGGSGGAAASGGPTVGGALDADEAWIEFYRWSLSQPWGPDAPYTGSQQFQQMVDKLRELGLPLESPAW